MRYTPPFAKMFRRDKKMELQIYFFCLYIHSFQQQQQNLRSGFYKIMFRMIINYILKSFIKKNLMSVFKMKLFPNVEDASEYNLIFLPMDFPKNSR